VREVIFGVSKRSQDSKRYHVIFPIEELEVGSATGHHKHDFEGRVAHAHGPTCIFDPKDMDLQFLSLCIAYL
jgi:hypothetical protein